MGKCGFEHPRRRPTMPASFKAGREHEMYQRILVAIDGSPTSRAGLEEAIRLAKVTGGRIKLVHVFDVLIGAEYGLAVNADAVAASLRAAGAELVDEAAAVVRKAGVP